MNSPPTRNTRAQLRRRIRLPRAPLIWYTVLAVVLVVGLVAVGWLLVNWQVDAIIMAIPAVVPLAIALAAVHWLDRWEPEPPMLLAFCFLYGAGASILGTLLTGNFLLDVASDYLETEGAVNAFSILVQGPVTEEVIKGAGLVVLLLIARREFNGPLDGFIYGAMIGAGFAFTENIVYFASSASTGIEFVWLLVVRCILSPFAHVLFTGMVGMPIGWAARRSEPWRFVVAVIGGLAFAIALHALWNGGNVLVLPLLGIELSNPFGWIIYYAIVQVPLFLLAAWFLVRLQEHDQEIIMLRLGEYRKAGWFTAGEIRMITDWPIRRAALRWAKEQPEAVGEAMRGFITEATRLAFAREHASVDKKDPNRRTNEKQLLERTRAHRAVLAEARKQRHAGRLPGV
ncbi:PrsW family intramembrane metalloprotease [Gulosibacter sp. 10]|uniref:PrsW family intramembrane metalloprotease n=1 Tax=Gulosibacter sp. 10 TaxID=1255570 RepID=UPI00097EC52E|nr:PrsW family intramembrane metalloprotease [Gulosibacter sp. 10]SJM48566.1 putative membrane protein [Gulosibacter sp. 10]